MSFIDSIRKWGDSINRKIKKIQRSNQEVKKRWVIGSSAVIMALVILTWLAYLNISTSQIVLENGTPNTEENNQSFFETVSRGASILYSESETGLSKLINQAGELFKKRREYEFGN